MEKSFQKSIHDDAKKAILVEDVDFVLTEKNKPCELIQACYSINKPRTYARER